MRTRLPALVSPGVSTDPPVIDGLPTRIRLLEQIGRGSSASVWRARDTHNGHDVAVKLLDATSGVEAELRAARLEREGRALARLRDLAGVVSLREIGLGGDGTAWLVMDLAQPGSLRDRLAASPGDVDVAELALRLATTLAHAHERGVVHGDIAPANVLFDQNGQPVFVDFGMAAMLGGGDGSSGTAGFTPAFAAPERLRGVPPDRPSDVYALAATIAAADTADSSEPADSADTARWSDLRRVCAAGLAATPQHRPTAREFAQRVGADPEDLPAGPAFGGRRRWPRRRQR